MSAVRPKLKELQLPVSRTKIPPKVLENAGDQVVTNVGFAFGWLRERREFGPITEQS